MPCLLPIAYTREIGLQYFCLIFSALWKLIFIFVFQIIMAKPAGGPRREQPAGGMDED